MHKYLSTGQLTKRVRYSFGKKLCGSQKIFINLNTLSPESGEIMLDSETPISGTACSDKTN